MCIHDSLYILRELLLYVKMECAKYQTGSVELKFGVQVVDNCDSNLPCFYYNISSHFAMTGIFKLFSHNLHPYTLNCKIS